MSDIIEKIIEIILWLLLIGLIVLVIYGMYSHTKYCESNPEEETCQVRETQTSSTNNGGIKCGYIFGKGIRCGIGF